MINKLEQLLITHQEGKITDEELDLQAGKIFEQDDRLKQQFLERVCVGLQQEEGVMDKERFDQIADQIEATSPNYWATVAGLRLLGKHFVSTNKESEADNK